MIIPTSSYDESYFDGIKAGNRHPGGYGAYVREPVGSEKWHTLAQKLTTEFDLVGKKVLEIGCAKGFVVEDMRSFGVDAYGVDVSSYAVSKATPAVAPFLTVADARTALKQYRDKELDCIFSLSFLVCIPEEDLPGLITDMNRVAKKQFHQVNVYGTSSHYVAKQFSWWSALPWENTTLFTANRNKNVTI